MSQRITLITDYLAEDATVTLLLSHEFVTHPSIGLGDKSCHRLLRSVVRQEVACCGSLSSSENPCRSGRSRFAMVPGQRIAGWCRKPPADWSAEEPDVTFDNTGADKSNAEATADIDILDGTLEVKLLFFIRIQKNKPAQSLLR